MSAAHIGWVFFRCARWAFWLATAAYYAESFFYPSNHLDSFGRLLHTTEFWMFSLPVAAVVCGFGELALREAAGFDRPGFLSDWSGKRPSPQSGL